MEIFDYDNILLLPRKCRVDSRSECDPRSNSAARRFKLPVVPANMKTVVDEADHRVTWPPAATST
jgi:GMP reductase